VTALITRRDIIDNNEEIVSKLLRTIQRTMLYILSDKNNEFAKNYPKTVSYFLGNTYYESSPEIKAFNKALSEARKTKIFPIISEITATSWESTYVPYLEKNTTGEVTPETRQKLVEASRNIYNEHFNVCKYITEKAVQEELLNPLKKYLNKLESQNMNEESSNMNEESSNMNEESSNMRRILSELFPRWLQVIVSIVFSVFLAIFVYFFPQFRSDEAHSSSTPTSSETKLYTTCFSLRWKEGGGDVARAHLTIYRQDKRPITDFSDDYGSSCPKLPRESGMELKISHPEAEERVIKLNLENENNPNTVTLDRKKNVPNDYSQPNISQKIQ
jgi:hypothetical protein